MRLLLCMNVKDEARVIERCLDSALSIADGWVICDTGSTDATVDLVHTVAARWGRPGRVVHHPWRNFGFNRTRSAQEARAQAEEWGWARERTYLLLLDADMIVEPAPEFDKQALDATYYQVVQDTGALSYLNTRLACLSHDWHAVGATHEYWQAPGDGRGERLDSLRIRDVGDGGSKGDKLMRDYRLLKQELARDPRNPRHTFYLGQTCFDAGRYGEAAESCGRRLGRSVAGRRSAGTRATGRASRCCAPAIRCAAAACCSRRSTSDPPAPSRSGRSRATIASTAATTWR